MMMGENSTYVSPRSFSINTMPFGLKNALGTFQHAMNVLLTKVKLNFSLVYLDNIVVFSQTPDENIDHV